MILNSQRRPARGKIVRVSLPFRCEALERPNLKTK